MRTSRMLFGLAVVAALAQVGAAAPSSVLKEIPAGSMGYVLVGDLEKSVNNVEKFIGELGLAEMIKLQAPDGLWAKLKAEAQFKEGFDPSRGMAVVMLDPKPLKIDLAELAQKAIDGQEPRPGSKIPFVIYVPAKNVDSFMTKLAEKEKVKVGRFLKYEADGGTMYAFEQGQYVLFSPLADALAAAADARKKAVDELSKDELALIERSDVAFHVNMGPSAPELKKLMTLAEKKMGEEMGRSGIPPRLAAMQRANLKMAMAMWSGLADQADSGTVGARFVVKGLVFEKIASFKPDSDIGKSLAACKPGAALPLGRLPNLNYVVAGGMASVPEGFAKDTVKTLQGSTTDLLSQMAPEKISEEMKARMKKLSGAYSEQITGGQVVLGGAGGKGAFGLAYVLECKDTAVLKKLIGEEVELGNEMIQALAGEDAEAKKLRIVYKTQGLSEKVDVIEITHPELTTMEEAARQQMTGILGEDKIRLLVATPDPKTVVVTFGGGEGFLQDALRASAGGGSLLKDVGILQATQYMPKQVMMFGSLNFSNLVKLIRGAADGIGMGPMLPPFEIKSQVPLACGAGAQGTAMHAAMYVPAEPIKEIIGIVQGFMTPPQRTQDGPPPDGENEF